ncbi:hypothetical protein [Pirellulimonas nuda]|uniref:hypothetical protein n=1 Tax=Pirellulimonas nuda TaxID=2528009 RepID=UPI0011A14904|nr:hypothetical protein [Pirellulimonas nuda]
MGKKNFAPISKKGGTRPGYLQRAGRSPCDNAAKRGKVGRIVNLLIASLQADRHTTGRVKLVFSFFLLLYFLAERSHD